MSHLLLRGAVATALLASWHLPVAQTASLTGPDPYLIQNVRVERDADGARAAILLRDGRIAAVLAPDAATPPGVRVVDGSELYALPGFVDAYSRAGTETAAPVADQDRPIDTQEDVRVDMRTANRKGIQPAFRAVDALAIDDGVITSWTDHGFGALLSSPGGELLAGDSALATVRDAAARDLVVDAAVHAHAAFGASGSGYPSTLMGYHSQLRQFFHDAARHAELTERYEQGRPGPRPAHDEELEAGVALLAGERLLVCEADTARDIERWLGLAEEFGLRIAITGGEEAWKVADRLAAQRIPVVLTLDWDDEVDDPAKEKEKEKKDSEDGDWKYVEPFGVRAERRRLWEEQRDCALRLHEAGVAFAFGTGRSKPKDLLENVRTAVEAGLPAEAAFEALTTRAAEFAGATKRLGRIAQGMDATLTLWTADPLTDKKAEPAWVFVDGFAMERELKPKKPDDGALGDGPADGVDVTGTWTLTVHSDEAPESASFALTMEEDGSVSGTYSLVMMPGMESEAEIEGQVNGNELRLSGSFTISDAEIAFVLTGTIDGDTIEGSSEVELPWESEPQSTDFTAAREPQKGGRQ